jgi:hypothetical protein
MRACRIVGSILGERLTRPGSFGSSAHLVTTTVTACVADLGNRHDAAFGCACITGADRLFLARIAHQAAS